MGQLVLALLVVAVVIGACALFYRYAMARSDEVMEVLEPDDPEDGEPDGTV